MAISAEQICGLALSRLGKYNSVNSIETPVTPEDIVFAKWFSICRQMTLKEIKPNFALHRDNIAIDATAPAFGYSYRYRIPSDCLAVLGFDEIQLKTNESSIEGEYILLDKYLGEEAPIRYVRDVEDVSKFTPEVVVGISFYLAYFCNMEITEDPQKQMMLEKMLPTKKAEMASVNGQENRPIRKVDSKFNKSRYQDNPSNSDKK